MKGALDAPAILRELDEQWRAAGAESPGGVLRACSMTLVAIAGPAEDALAASRTLGSIIQAHPARTILMRLEEGGTVEARVAIQCWMPHGSRRHVCSEHIEIRTAPERVGEAQPLLFGLMAPDLPVVVWAPDAGLAASKRLEPVLALAGKVIVETSRADCQEAAAALQRLRSRCRLADLAWTRITRWRERIAQEVTAEEEDGGAEVAYAGAGLPMAAQYLAAWLAVRRGKPVELRCEDPEPPAPGMGRIRQVRIGRVTMRRIAPAVVVTECRGVCSKAVFPLLDDAGLLCEELGVTGRDRHFEDALDRILERCR